MSVFVLEVFLDCDWIADESLQGEVDLEQTYKYFYRLVSVSVSPESFKDLRMIDTETILWNPLYLGQLIDPCCSR